MMQDVTHETAPHAFVKAVHGVRYQVTDVARSSAFFTQYLGWSVLGQRPGRRYGESGGFSCERSGRVWLSKISSSPSHNGPASVPTGLSIILSRR
ncbi:hypothetical protein LuPra_01378 [Luteitalea pratensis]|uniref:Uncharacterized protein n=1 Tax=Luteitalea pratensis TaxID=1855912 RepID=A0A143PIF8_LUTPR|nr:hypothetical protein LuPra_01378 [Luteitalea pratensis]